MHLSLDLSVVCFPYDYENGILLSFTTHQLSRWLVLGRPYYLIYLHEIFPLCLKYFTGHLFTNLLTNLVTFTTYSYGLFFTSGLMLHTGTTASTPGTKDTLKCPSKLHLLRALNLHTTFKQILRKSYVAGVLPLKIACALPGGPY